MHFVITIKLSLVEYRYKNKILKENIRGMKFAISASLTESFRTPKSFFAESWREPACVCAHDQKADRRIARDRHFAQPAYPKFNFTPEAAEGEPECRST